MPQCCSVPFCSEKSPGHRFPRDKERQNKWVSAIRRTNFTPTKHSRICKRHFRTDDYELPKESFKKIPTRLLKRDAVPSIFSWTEEVIENKKNSTCVQISNQQPLKIEEDSSRRDINGGIVSECSIKIELIKTESIQKDVKVQCSLCICNKVENVPAGENKKKILFCVEYLKGANRNAELKFYTGFHNYEHFMFVFNLLGDEVNHLMSLKTNRNSVRVLSPCNEFLLTLIKLHRNMCNKELSFRFNITPDTVNDIVVTWMNFLYGKFGELDMWSGIQVLDNELRFQGATSPCIVIYYIYNNSAKVKMDRPKNSHSLQLINSDYKSTSLIKILVAVSVSDRVMYVSDAHCGSISNREFFEKSGAKKAVLQSDFIDMEEILNENSGQFESPEFRLSKDISKIIYVKRVMGLGKTFKILSSKLDPTFLPLRRKIIFICFMLSNYWLARFNKSSDENL